MIFYSTEVNMHYNTYIFFSTSYAYKNLDIVKKSPRNIYYIWHKCINVCNMYLHVVKNANICSKNNNH